MKVLLWIQRYVIIWIFPRVWSVIGPSGGETALKENEISLKEAPYESFPDHFDLNSLATSPEQGGLITYLSLNAPFIGA